MHSTAAATSPEAPEPLAVLAALSSRLANVVEAISRRGDVRDLRARMLILLLRLRCPLHGRKDKPWYVAGAVARLGAEGLRRAWRGFYGEEPPVLRTIRKHLGELEQGLALVRSPGDWMPIARDENHPERRPRYPETFHLLEAEEDAEWWAREGRYRLEASPAARWSPDAWRAAFRAWRLEAGRLGREPLLPFEGGLAAASSGQNRPQEQRAAQEQAIPVDDRRLDTAESRPIHRRVRGRVEPTERHRELARRAAAAARLPGALEVLGALAPLGAAVGGLQTQLRLAREPARLRRAVLLLARAWQRGDEIRNPAGWLVRAFDHAPEVQVIR